MKILQLIHKRQNRGAETFACQLSNHLQRMGHQVRLISLFEGEADLPFHGQIISLKASPGLIPLDFSALKRLQQCIKEFDPDVVQANSGDTLKYAVLSKIVYGWENPVVARNASEVGRYLRSPFQTWANALLYKNVAGVVSVSRASEKDILSHFSFLEGKTEVVPVGLEATAEIENISLKPEYGKHIVHVGGFTFEKNHHGLLNIFQMVLETNADVNLHLIGDGPLRSEIENEVETRNLENVYFYGFIDNPLPFIKAADVLVLPSIIEGLPGVLLEGMYCETPVIAYNVGGIPEIIREDTGIVIGKNDEVSFSKALIGILEEPEDCRVQHAREYVMKEFMNKEIAIKFVNCYGKFVSLKH